MFLVQVIHLTVIFFETPCVTPPPLPSPFIMKSKGIIDEINYFLTVKTNEEKRQYVLNSFENGDIVVFSALICGSFGMISEKRESLMGTIIKREFGMFTIKVDKPNIVCGIYTAFPAHILKFVQDTNVPDARIQALDRGFICRKHQLGCGEKIPYGSERQWVHEIGWSGTCGRYNHTYRKTDWCQRCSIRLGLE